MFADRIYLKPSWKDNFLSWDRDKSIFPQISKVGVIVFITSMAWPPRSLVGPGAKIDAWTPLSFALPKPTFIYPYIQITPFFLRKKWHLEKYFQLQLCPYNVINFLLILNRHTPSSMSSFLKSFPSSQGTSLPQTDYIICEYFLIICLGWTQRDFLPLIAMGRSVMNVYQT